MTDQTTCDQDPVLIALTSLIPGGRPENMTAVITETTPDGAQHTWNGSLDGLAQHIRDAAPEPTADTLPEWLCQRFGGLDPAAPFPEIDRAYWEHQAAAVRRAVARGGFKNPMAGAR